MTIVSLMELSRQYPIFSLEDCQKWFPRSQRATLILQLSQHAAKGRIVRLKPGLFVLNSQPLPDAESIASRLDVQSIVSLETVLHRSGMIPEIPFALTAVTPLKTQQFHIPPFGTFLFRHLKPQLLFGWAIQEHAPYAVRFARPEKALLDLFWFHRFEKDPDGYLHELRLTIPRRFSWKIFVELARQYSHPQFVLLVKAFLRRYRKSSLL